MKITDAPTPIATPFAQNGTRNDIPDTDPGFTGDTAGRAAFATGFPEITMRPIAAGGVPPFGADFNGILYALSNAVRFYGAGGHYKFNADFASKIGGYPMGATAQATDNMGHWLNVVEANSTDPESGLSTGWLPLADHNGTATVTLTASTALTPLQAAKANLRFTGTPTGNVTVTFPAWTKRYSIINDCTGDGSVICTTGNGESISIKNGAKYEVGCDGKNLTVATVNASQVFADANKNISALDAPTVQQLLNALGSAAAHAASDFDASGSAKTAADALAQSLAKIATTGNMADAVGTLAIEHGGTGATDAAKARDNLGLKAGATMIKSDANVTQLSGNANEAATTEQLVQLRERCPIGDSTRRLGFVNGDKTRPYMLSSTGEIIELERRVVTYGEQYSGRRVYADGYCEQWGRASYSDIASTTTATTVTVQFPVTFSQVFGCIGNPDTTQKVSLSRRNLSTSSVLFDLREFSDGAIGGSIGWRAWGYL